jgi:hypothetical protein
MSLPISCSNVSPYMQDLPHPSSCSIISPTYVQEMTLPMSCSIVSPTCLVNYPVLELQPSCATYVCPSTLAPQCSSSTYCCASPPPLQITCPIVNPCPNICRLEQNVPANYLALCRDWLTDFQPPPAPCPSACSRQLLPYGVLACAPDLRYPTLPDAPTGNDLLCYGAMNWPVQCEDLSKLTVQAILMGPSTLVGDDVDEYLHLANEFLDAIIFEHPTYLNEPNELTEEARKAARSGTHNALALLQGAQAGAPGLHSTLILSPCTGSAWFLLHI